MRVKTMRKVSQLPNQTKLTCKIKLEQNMQDNHKRNFRNKIQTLNLTSNRGDQDTKGTTKATPKLG